jgi:hypothetical protein
MKASTIAASLVSVSLAGFASSTGDLSQRAASTEDLLQQGSLFLSCPVSSHGTVAQIPMGLGENHPKTEQSVNADGIHSALEGYTFVHEGITYVLREITLDSDFLLKQERQSTAEQLEHLQKVVDSLRLELSLINIEIDVLIIVVIGLHLIRKRGHLYTVTPQP